MKGSLGLLNGVCGAMPRVSAFCPPRPALSRHDGDRGQQNADPHHSISLFPLKRPNSATANLGCRVARRATYTPRLQSV